MSINKLVASVAVSLVLVAGVAQVANAGASVNPGEGKAACDALGGKWQNNRCKLSDN